MSFLKTLFGRRSQAETLPRCASCGGLIRKHGVRGGIVIFPGTECPDCGKAYCLNCHNFSQKGPKCPSCGQWKLGPLMRADG
jgi:predicted RNA-binding Zn-ribbon protein involved in translation (DUF1610 family)